MENLKLDAKRLVGKILGDTYEDNILIHISQSEYSIYSFPNSPEIPSCYGYVIDRTPKYLQKEGVLLILTSGYYVLRDFNRLLVRDSLRNWSDGYSQVISSIYKKFTNEVHDFSGSGFYTPAEKNIATSAARGLFFIVINRQKAMLWLERIKEEEQKMISKPQERPFWYENRQLYFKLNDGSVDQLDFSNAEKSRKLFDAFWDLSKDGRGKYTTEEVLKRYELIHHIKIQKENIAKWVSNARNTIVFKKEGLKQRVIWHFDKTDQKWIFKIS